MKRITARGGGKDFAMGQVEDFSRVKNEIRRILHEKGN